MKQLFLSLILATSLLACKKGKTSSPVVTAPGKAILQFPEANSTCTKGTLLPATEESTVAFSWNSSTDSETYDVYIKNLLSGVISTKSSSSTQLQVNLKQNTPYSWYVVSKSSQTLATSKSEVWKFYNTGAATSSYAPFPADLLLPTNGQKITATGDKIVLDWNGYDVDNDLIGYDIYMGSNLLDMVMIKNNNTESILNDVIVKKGATYYWKVVTKDSKGNSSASETFWFIVN